MDAQFTFEKKFSFRRIESLLGFLQTDILPLGNFCKRPHDFEMPMLVLEVWLTFKAVVRGNNSIFFRGQDARYLTAIPYVESTFLVFRIGIHCRVIAAFRICRACYA